MLLDSTPVECGRSVETSRRSDLADVCGYGYCESHSRRFWGLRLELTGVPADRARDVLKVAILPLAATGATVEVNMQITASPENGIPGETLDLTVAEVCVSSASSSRSTSSSRVCGAHGVPREPTIESRLAARITKTCDVVTICPRTVTQRRRVALREGQTQRRANQPLGGRLESRLYRATASALLPS